ncbi:hypothetical protein EVAR_10655_1 [Eumeta japonica]|uniref:Uncharacterized protein n=1 Tax=Eumeta variegata TaxID=151549 RepID=A0A4C1U8E4_EUMVA|nr:hypothetical protein EVAR_10655_1 [Eumeta japonica]
MEKGDYKNIAVLTGFAEMEGISRTEYFEEWADEMKKDFTDFLPADLKLDDDATKKRVTEEIKAFYFGAGFDNLKKFH